MYKSTNRSSETGRPFGGQYVSEAMIESLEDLQDAFENLWSDLDFRQEFNDHLAVIRPPTQLQYARQLSKLVGGPRIYLKREDLNCTGSHSITNALGQVLLARRLNKKTVLAETGSGCHGVATAAMCEKLRLECMIFMGSKDMQARPDQVERMKSKGAKVVEVTAGDGTIREAIAEVLRAAVERYETTYPLLGGAYGPRPIPTIANAFQATTGAEVKRQILRATGRLPDAIVACAGVHSPGVGLFDPFIENRSVRLIAVEGAGCGVSSELHAAVLTNGSPGVYHGAHTLVLQDIHGQIEKVYSNAPDLRYPGVSPWLARWASEGRLEPVAIADDEAVLGCAILSRTEGIECSIEDGHAVAAAMEAAQKMTRDQSIVICLGGGV